MYNDCRSNQVLPTFGVKHANRSMVFMFLMYLLVLLARCSAVFNSSFTPNHIRYLQNETRALFEHGWNAYIDHGFPLDEVKPLLCEPYGPDYDDIYDVIRNDAMGNTTLTILDNIDSLIIFEQWEQLKFVLQFLKNEKETLFQKNTIVQVFETTIRALGGLLSAHLLLTDVVHGDMKSAVPKRYAPLKEIADSYDGFLLEMAYELGLKLLPAFKTHSSIPLPRINLLQGIQGVPRDLQDENCLAGAMSPVLEFTLLSRLTGDTVFEQYSQATFWKIWNGKLTLGLLPMTLNPLENTWKDSVTGIGASGDSFYEYAAKSAIIFNDESMWDVFTASYRALLHHLAEGNSGTVGSAGMIFPNVHVNEGSRTANYIDLLSAFWTGLQVLTGQLSDAINTHLLYLKIWNTFDLIPERWQLIPKKISNSDADSEIDKLIAAVSLEWYPLRPEFIESTYYLYRATRDPMYLQIGERILNLLRNRYKAPCGFYGIQDVRTGERNDRMETFVLGETLKYLYLLFDVNDEIFLHSELMKAKNWVFSTEAHPLWLGRNLLRTPVARNETDNEDHPAPEKKRFGKLFSFLKGQTRELSTDHVSSFYRKTLLPEIPYSDIPGLEPALIKKDAFIDRFYYCEANPFAKYQKNQRFLTSGYYHWEGIFAPDEKYNKTLIRPSYLPKEDHQIELTSSFTDIYGMIAVNQYNQESLWKCPHPPTTKLTDLFFGDRALGNMLEVSKVLELKGQHANGSHMRANDLWVPEIQGLRVIVEELRVGTYDLSSNLISKKYMNAIFNYPRISRRKEKALRVIRVNGVQVAKDAIIWSRPIQTPVVDPQSQTVLLDVNVKNQLILDGVLVENWLFWKDGNTTRVNFPK